MGEILAGEVPEHHIHHIHKYIPTPSTGKTSKGEPQANSGLNWYAYVPGMGNDVQGRTPTPREEASVLREASRSCALRAKQPSS